MPAWTHRSTSAHHTTAPTTWPCRAAYGVALLAATVPGASRAVGLPTDQVPGHRVSTALVRVLGVRHLTQAALEAWAHTRGRRFTTRARQLSAALDAVHLASLPLLAIPASPAQRRLIALDAPMEALLGAITLR